MSVLRLWRCSRSNVIAKPWSNLLIKPLNTTNSFDEMGNIESQYKEEVNEILKGYEEKKKRRQSIIGVVVSTKCSKSVTVKYQHPKFYPKYNSFGSLAGAGHGASFVAAAVSTIFGNHYCVEF